MIRKIPMSVADALAQVELKVTHSEALKSVKAKLKRSGATRAFLVVRFFNKLKLALATVY